MEEAPVSEDQGSNPAKETGHFQEDVSAPSAVPKPDDPQESGSHPPSPPSSPPPPPPAPPHGKTAVGREDTPAKVNHGYGRSAARVCACSQLSMGVVAVISHVAVLAIVFTHRSKWRQYDFQDSAYGIWCGGFFFLSGVFGLCSSRSRTNGYIVTFMVFSLWSWVFSIILITLSGTVISARSYEVNDCEYSYNASTRVEEIVCRTWLMAPLMILNGVIIGSGFLEFVAAIWAVAITGTALRKDQCCNRCCSCCCPSPPLTSGVGGYQPVQYIVTNGTTTLANGQQAMVILLPTGGSGLIPLDMSAPAAPNTASGAASNVTSSAPHQSFIPGGQLVPLFPTISFPDLFPPMESHSLPPPVNPSYLSSASTTPGDSERGFV